MSDKIYPVFKPYQGTVANSIQRCKHGIKANRISSPHDTSC